jgi:L-asparaginase II
MTSTVLVEVLRGGHVESRHMGAFAVADSQGGLVMSGGDVERAIYPRSAIKALQALPLVVSGAASRFDLAPDELALACASHAGAPVHTAAAARMLARAGRDQFCLECGTHWPSSDVATRALAADGQQPTPLHNNCSGKHAGFICTAVAAGRGTAGYVRPDHPVMRDVTGAVAAVTRARVDDQVPAVDGCSIPTFRIPLRALAEGFARFGTGEGMPEGFADAAALLRGAVAAHPVMLSGVGRFDTRVAEAMGEAAFVKVGAEGVYCGALPALGLGFALKCDDGAQRAAEVATAALLRRFLGSNPVLDELASLVLRNWQGVAVGGLRATLQ